MRKLFIVLAGLLAGFVFAVIGSAQSAQALPVSSTTSVPATNTTPIQVGTVDQFNSLTLTATGTTAFCNNAPQCFNITPDGGPFACGAAGSCPLNSALVGALIYKVGDGPWQFAGSGPVTVTTTSPTSLPVYVLYNDVFGTYYDNSGSYTVTATGAVVTNPGCTGTIITGTHGAITVPPRRDDLRRARHHHRRHQRGPGRHAVHPRQHRAGIHLGHITRLRSDLR